MKYKKYYEIFGNEKSTGPFSKEDYDFFKKHNLSLYFHAREYSAGKVDTLTDKNTLLVCKLQYKKNVSELCCIGKALEANNIQYLVMKGITVSETYPEPYTRQMGDHDILVKPCDFNQAKKALSDMGYSEKEHTSTYKDISLIKEGVLAVELHHALLHSGREPYADVFTDALWQSSVRLELFSGRIFVPSPEMHFRYIVLHMMKHLKAGGFGLKALLDFKYFSTAYNIHLEDQFVFFNEIGYGEFYRGIVTLCHYELGLAMDSTEWLFDREEAAVQILSDYLFEGGAFGNYSEQHRINERFEKYKRLTASKNKGEMINATIFSAIRMVLNKNIGVKEKLFLFNRNKKFIAEKDYMMKKLGLREDRQCNGQE